MTVFDLDAYIGRYPPTSETRLQRLLYIAQKTQDLDLCSKAYQLAERQMKEMQNTISYKQVFGSNSAAAQKGGVVYDQSWVEDTETQAQVFDETLEERTSTAQAHLDKEAIRTAYLARGEFHRQRGDLRSAMRNVLRSRDYCTNRTQTSHVCLLVMELAMDLGNYHEVLDYVSKAENSAIPGDSSFSMKLKVASGLAHLAEGRFLQAAQQLTSIVPPDGSVADEPIKVGGSFCSAEDVVFYGALSGLATLERPHLLMLLEMPGFLELVPPMREAVQLYCRADYPGCLRTLQSIHHFMELDMLLAPHLEKLSETILEKCGTEYLRPYRRVSLPQMADTFSMPLDRLVVILTQLIGKDEIPHARIDCRTQTLERRSELEPKKQKIATKLKIKAMEQQILDESYAMMIRAACLENEVQVDRRKTGFHHARRQHGAHLGGMAEGDSDFDDDAEMEMEVGNPEDAY